jgi:hypothetical protein
MSLRPIIGLVLLFALSDCTTLEASRKPLPIGEVVELSKAGTPAALIIQRIRDSHTTYALRGADFAKLKANGVPDPVLDYLQKSFVDDLVLQTRYSITGEIILGGCSWCYPQPVDVDKLESGFGVVAATPPGQYQIGRPMGTPDWLAYPQHPPSGASIALWNIEQMSRDGVPEAQIIEQIKHAPLMGLIAGGTSTVRTQPPVGLRGSTLALLYERGVAYSVLNALQEQFLGKRSPEAVLTTAW